MPFASRQPKNTRVTLRPLCDEFLGDLEVTQRLPAVFEVPLPGVGGAELPGSSQRYRN
jgi:hypothetical protein